MYLNARQGLVIQATNGRTFAAFAVMANVAEAMLARRPGVFASIVIWPGVLVACTMTCASPLKRLRFEPLSDSWQFGSPFPTPMIDPGPETVNAIRSLAVGTKRPFS